MNATAAIAKSLLAGHTLNIKSAFRLFGVTNLPREIGRLIERRFHIRVNRQWHCGLTRYNIPCNWVDYSLKRDKLPKAKLLAMREYIAQQQRIAKFKTNQYSTFTITQVNKLVTDGFPLKFKIFSDHATYRKKQQFAHITGWLYDFKQAVSVVKEYKRRNRLQTTKKLYRLDVFDCDGEFLGSLKNIKA
jgi:hypothetical protein